MHRTLPAVLLGLLLLAPHSSARADDQPGLKEALALQEAFQEAIRKAEPSVVCILVSRDDDPTRARTLKDPDTVPEAYGSGVVIGVRDGRALILTNYHVIKDAKQLYVRLPGGKGSEVLPGGISSDSYSDLAVLKLKDPIEVKPIKFGDGDKVRKGQLVLSLANPFAAGFPDGSPSASWGIISNLRRAAPGKPPLSERDLTRLALQHYGILLQIDARLNLGCSGGALIDLKGELIGLTTSQAALLGTETPAGFAVPLNARMRAIIDKLARGQEVEYGFLGVSFDPSTSQRPGARITKVINGSPAQQAGVPENSLIQAVDGQPIRTNDDFALAIRTHLAGSQVQLQVAGRPQPIKVTLTKLYLPHPFQAPNRPAPVHGLRVDYTSVLTQRTNLNTIPSGVFVSEVQPGSPAEKAGLLDAVVTQVNGQRVGTPAEFYRAAARRPGPIELTVLKGAQRETVKLD